MSNREKPKLFASEIAAYLGCELYGANLEVQKVCALNKVEAAALAFCDKNRYDFPAVGAVFVTGPGQLPQHPTPNAFLPVDNPRHAYARIVERYFFQQRLLERDDSAYIDKTARLASGVKVGRNVVIEGGTEIGMDTVIDHGAVILRNTIIGSNCFIGANSVIGSEGLGSVRDDAGIPIMTRHLGRVRIEDFVEIGPASTVACGTIDETAIGQHTKIGPQVNIGHNSVIGSCVEIAGRATLSGSVRVGDHSFIGTGAIIGDGGITVGVHAKVGMGAIVQQNVEDYSTVLGFRALPIRRFLQVSRNIGYDKS